MLDRRAIGNAVLQRQDHEIAGRQLRDLTVVDVLVALVLDGDRRQRPVLVDGDGIRLATEIAGGVDLFRRDIDDGKQAGGLGETFTGVDGDQRLWAGDSDRRRLALEGNDAAGLRRAGVGDIDEADTLAGAVRIDERVAVLAGGNDFRRGRCLLVGAFGQVAGDRKGCNAVKDLFGLSGRRRRCGECRRQGGCDGKSPHLSLLSRRAPGDQAFRHRVRVRSRNSSTSGWEACATVL